MKLMSVFSFYQVAQELPSRDGLAAVHGRGIELF